MAGLNFPYWATNDVVVPGTTDPNKDKPDQIQLDEGWTTTIPELQHMNWIQNNFSEWIRRMNEITYVADGETMEVGRLHGVVGNITIKLPADAEIGQQLRVGPTIGVNLEVSPVTVQGNGFDIMSAGTTEIILDLPTTHFLFDFNGTQWDVSIVGFQPNQRVGATL